MQTYTIANMKQKGPTPIINQKMMNSDEIL